jgi:hypothetical protein
MELIWFLMLDVETLAAILLSASQNVRKENPALAMNLRKQAYRLIGLSRK